MPAATDLRPTIQQALAAFGTQPLPDAARAFFKTLGYTSDRTIPVGSIDAFCHQFDPEGRLAHPSALRDHWKSVHLVFQLTNEELSATTSLFQDTAIKPGLLSSYLFFALDLTGKDYARGKLTGIARQLNRIFPMPVMLLLRHGDSTGAPVLSIAVINRRQNKLHADRDVLEKVTLIRDIALTAPHRGHLDILASFAVPNLVHPQRLPINSFDALHAAWEQIFNIDLLNERFYRELANWYFWALPQVDFPADLEPDAEKRRATGLIRLLTRLIFCWFLKEKGLIPEKLFHPADLAQLLKGFDPESETSSTYYQAILQNLFFATLNQRMGKDSNGKPYRVFAKDEGWMKNKATYDINNLYRYEALFRDGPDAALAHFADIPFLNGGLFECLDRTEDGTDKKRYLDGFSRNAKKRPHVPDRLFFDSGETADLSTAYGDTKRRAEKVTGLISILNRYKFTIVENTPIDQEIALDPELLGKVFENLLASYNEETKTTARKQTGSFYTPRPIVDYMVDESLKAYLKRKVAETILSRSPNDETILSRSHPAHPAPDKMVGATLLPYNPDAPTKISRHNLPHWSQAGTTYWITFRLADSLPQEKLRAWKAERDTWAENHPEPWSDSDWQEYHERFGERLENWLDAGEGDCHLRRPEVRAIVERCLRHFDGDRYELGPWVIMPNHVHLLLRPGQDQSLSKILQGIKGVSAKECNALLGRTGQAFWQEESFDHIDRSQAQFDRFVRYIADNPIKAKLQDSEFSQSSTDKNNPDKSNSDKSSPDNPVGVSPKDPETGLSRLRSNLDLLFTYTETPHRFTESEVATLITAIDEVKILDPACGSGAFPMGVLHKLVYILGKLDPDNERWKQTQLAKLDSAPMREELERAFADNNDDYGRKLYLIENCLYGVDIQPIAIQITKLRFFISLVCDQKTNRNKKDNHGIRPLPNLETKFVAANTLIGLPEMDQMELVDPRVYKIEAEIEALYHRHFSIQRRDQKLAVQSKVKALRKEMAEILAVSLMTPAKSKHVAEWDPFDPQSSAAFFDPHWMFGRTLADGVDVIIGNPPYRMLQPHNTSQAELDYFRTHYVAADFKIELFHLFLQRGTSLLSPSGCLGYIVPTTLLNNVYAEKLRQWLMSRCAIKTIAISPIHVFAEADVHTSVVILTRETNAGRRADNLVDTTTELTSEFAASPGNYARTLQSRFTALQGCVWNVLLNETNAGLIEKIRRAGQPLEVVAKINRGLITGNRKQFFSEKKLTERHVSILTGADVKRYSTKEPNEFVLFERPESAGGCWDKDVHLAPHKVVVRQIGTKPTASFIAEPIAVTGNIFTIRGKSAEHEKLILGIVNSALIEFFWGIMFSDFKSTFPQVTIFSLAQVPVSDAPTGSKGFDSTQKTVIRLVDEILAAKRTDAEADTSELERAVDTQVYALYGLTSEEVAIIKSQTK